MYIIQSNKHTYNWIFLCALELGSRDKYSRNTLDTGNSGVGPRGGGVARLAFQLACSTALYPSTGANIHIGVLRADSAGAGCSQII